MVIEVVADGDAVMTEKRSIEDVGLGVYKVRDRK